MENTLNRNMRVKGMQTTDIVLAGALLAAGAVLRVFVPPVFGITPNFVIVMYCLIIYLVKPKLSEVIGISLIAALICHFTSKSAIPYINFLSEPLGAIVAYVLVKSPFPLSIKGYSFKPAVVTFMGTITSGLVYITTMKFVLLFKGAASNKAFTALLIVVAITAAANTIIAQMIYHPVKTSLRKND